MELNKKVRKIKQVNSDKLDIVELLKSIIFENLIFKSVSTNFILNKNE
jgi:hypothetical protein